MVHGMAGSFAADYYAHVLGDALAEAGVGYVFAHNRGYGHANDIAVRPPSAENNGYWRQRIGVAYERFEDCVLDIQAWFNQCRELGYKRIILFGHSLGCNKALYYLHRNEVPGLAGVILGSPPDMVAMVEANDYQPNHGQLMKQAQELVAEGKPRELLSGLIWDCHFLSAQTYIDLFSTGGPADNLPVWKNPDQWPELASVKVPMLVLMGEFDDIRIRTLEADLDLITQKATSSPEVTGHIIPGANHDYDNREAELAEVVVGWVKTVE
jgi:pimeloyl-ACP methyl ester carboxylesterase